MPKIVYSSRPQIKNLNQLFENMWGDLCQSVGLAWRLALRDINAQYRQAALGFLWILFTPLIDASIWIFLNLSGAILVRDTGVPYPIYVLVGTMFWSFFTESISMPLSQFESAKPILAKLNFPKEALILAGIYKTTLNACIRMVITVIVITLLGAQLKWSILLVLFGGISLILVGTMLGLLISPIGLLYTDTSRATNLVVRVLIYTTPTLFPIPEAGIGRVIIMNNPLTPLIVTPRDWMLGLSAEFVSEFVLVTVIGFFMLLFFWLVFRISFPVLAERLSA